MVHRVRLLLGTVSVASLIGALYACGSSSSGDNLGPPTGGAGGSAGSSSNGGAGGAGGTSAAGGNGGGAGTAGAGGAGASGGSGGTGGGGPTIAGVVVVQGAELAQGATGVENAVFNKITTSDCKTTTDGACTIVSCGAPVPDGGAPDAGGADAGDDAGDAGAPPAPNPGTIEISGGKLKAPIALTPGTDGTYTAQTQQLAPFAGGDTLVAKAVGASIPAFNQMVKAPDYLVLENPQGGPVTIDRKLSFVVSWTTSPNGTARFVIVQPAATPGGPSVTAYCDYMAGAATATIPATTLGKFAAGTGRYGFVGLVENKFTSGAASVDFLAVSQGQTSQGNPASGDVTFK